MERHWRSTVRHDHGARVHLPELDGLQRPRWRSAVPALWRDSTTIQLGDDIVIDRLDADLLSWLRSIDGLRTRTEIEEHLPIDTASARRILRGLLAAGALDDAACTPTGARWAGRHRRDTLALHLEALVSIHRDSRQAASILDRRDRHRVAITGDGPLREEIALALETAGINEVAAVRRADLVILADAHHPDVPAHFDHDAMDQPHLHVGAFGNRATIGPLVVPGRTSCLRCAHLHRRDADAAWPLLAVQWGQAVSAMGRAPIDPLLVRAAAVHSAVLVRAHADHPDDPSRWAGWAVHVRLPDLASHRESRPSHPLCGCLWQAA